MKIKALILAKTYQLHFRLGRGIRVKFLLEKIFTTIATDKEVLFLKYFKQKKSGKIDDVVSRKIK